MKAGLDERITDSFSVVGLLIAVVAGYLAAVWPVIAGLLNTPRPEVSEDRRALAARCSAYARACWTLTAAAVLVLLIMAPLTLDVVETINPKDSVNTVRASVALFSVFLAGAVVTAVCLALRLSRRANGLRT